MTLERQAGMNRFSGIHTLLLTAYLAAAGVGLISALFAPWFKWGFLLIGTTATAGAAMIVNNDRKHAATQTGRLYGRARVNFKDVWVVFMPLALIVGLACWQVASAVIGFLFG